MKINVNFINGACCEILENNKNQYYVQFIDKKTDKIIYDEVINSNMWVRSAFSYFIDYRIKIIDFNTKILIDQVDYDATNKNVYIWFDSSSLGDNISWMPFVEEFRIKHKCRVFCSTYQNDIFKSIYPDIVFVPHGVRLDNLYASYSIGCFDDKTKERVSWKTLNNQEIAANLLGIDYKEIKPPIKINNATKLIEQKYVVISTRSTAGCKEWNLEFGWREVILYLNQKGYKVILVQKERDEILEDSTLDIVHCNSTDMDYLLNVIYYSEFVVGLSSGISWLAWALNKPCVLISGMSLERNEFFTPFRVINKNVCYGCWNDEQFKFDRDDWFWCPKLKNTDRQFECTKSITPKMVLDKIEVLIN